MLATESALANAARLRRREVSAVELAHALAEVRKTTHGADPVLLALAAALS